MARKLAKAYTQEQTDSEGLTAARNNRDYTSCCGNYNLQAVAACWAAIAWLARYVACAVIIVTLLIAQACHALVQLAG